MRIAPTREESTAASRRNAFIARVLIPGALLVAGIVLSVIGLLTDSPAGAIGPGLIFAAGLVKIGGSLVRLGNASQHDRDREQEAREHFERTGRWPDD